MVPKTALLSASATCKAPSKNCQVVGALGASEDLGDPQTEYSFSPFSLHAMELFPWQMSGRWPGSHLRRSKRVIGRQAQASYTKSRPGSLLVGCLLQTSKRTPLHSLRLTWKLPKNSLEDLVPFTEAFWELPCWPEGVQVSLKETGRMGLSVRSCRFQPRGRGGSAGLGKSPAGGSNWCPWVGSFRRGAKRKPKEAICGIGGSTGLGSSIGMGIPCPKITHWWMRIPSRVLATSGFT